MRVMTDEPLLYRIFMAVLLVSIYSCLLMLHGEQPVLFSQCSRNVCLLFRAVP